MPGKVLRAAGLGLLFLCLVLRPALALDGLVEKRSFTLPSYVTQGGRTIQDLTVGWEAYGTLNEARDNVILITQFFGGSGHAAGRYRADDPYPGYWDALIGPGRALDTDRFYIVAADTPVNLGAHSPDVITTGPATIDPATGRPYGLDFPVLTIGDFVEVQRALLDSLGIERLHAVMGASMGALQAYDWAIRYPERVRRLIPVVGAAWADASLIAWLDAWAAPIRLDPAWNGGDYYGGEPPLRGLTAALEIANLQSFGAAWADRTFGRAWADAEVDPAAALDNRYAVQAGLAEAAAAQAKIADANHFLYLVKAIQLYDARDVGLGLAAIAAPTLILYSPEDEIFAAATVEETARLIAADGTPVRLEVLRGGLGHLDGILGLAQANDAIGAFLSP